MISTNYVFPRIIKASEEKALIWDQTYWKLFSLYLAYFTDLNANTILGTHLGRLV